ncbi:MAG: hypothetical protein AB7D39_06645 [Pseudodesulfovibrio sp.]|uniref:hypothetical protein n=1 Tax=Pseudodesulfovibrio sp. TaxID=2035812 RepID=UPI003D0DE174
MSESTCNAPPSVPAAACVPFSGLGQAMQSVEAAALSYAPCWGSVPAAVRPHPEPVRTYGYALQCRLCREIRAG